VGDAHGELCAAADLTRFPDAQPHASHTIHAPGLMVPTFRPLTAEDLLMLHEWLQRPHVRQWWKEPTTIADLRRDYLQTAAEEGSTRAYIALLEDTPIGFIQSYVVMGSGDGWWEDETDPGARGIDQFLAHASLLGQGLGSTLARAFVDRLFENPRVTTVQTDPSPENERAIRCYHRAGFVALGEVVTPDGPALLMRTDRSNSGKQTRVYVDSRSARPEVLPADPRPVPGRAG
jgi:RimJ/RimL family protein N-acetyltransferase